MPKKLIEVAMPLDAINAASTREKSIRHGHPSTLHLWWSRKPLATARAIIWASIVDDPSAHPEKFPTEELQAKERDRLFHILEDLVRWENSNNPDVLRSAREAMIDSVGPDLPVLLDPFAGGGSIPLEAQRLGLEAHAHDLNPVSVIMNKAMIELPAMFANQEPVNPLSQQKLGGGGPYVGSAGLAEDIQYYGQWMKEEAFRRIGHLYPMVTLPDGTQATAIAWLWSRTVTCPNPACGCEVPLASSFDISKKTGNAHHTAPCYSADGELHFEVGEGNSTFAGSVNRNGGVCLRCGTPIEFGYIRTEGQREQIGSVLMGVVAESPNGRVYVSPSATQIDASRAQSSDTVPSVPLPDQALGFRVQLYGLDNYSKLFTERQAVALTTFSDLVDEARHKVTADARNVGADQPEEYGKAVATYLAFVVDKMSDYHSSVCSWHVSRELLSHTFVRQAIPMVWDYAEANPFSCSSGSWNNMLEWVTKTVLALPAAKPGRAEQHDARTDANVRDVLVSSDPPYYDNIGYADLSDFFYIWLRRSLRDSYPDLFRRMQVPKDEELVATPHRHDGNKQKAKEFFESGMQEACKRMYEAARDDLPVTIYYAYKQQDQVSRAGDMSSSGWETMLSAITAAGFCITGTWPLRTEMKNRPRGQKSNALASSVVLVCRKRSSDAGVVSRQEFVRELRSEMRESLKLLQASNIAPVDMAQAAIGPGMAIYSKYSQVLNADGSPVEVRTALEIINQELDAYLSEQTQELDGSTRLCLDIYSQFGFEEMPFGDADVLARAKNTSIGELERRSLVQAEKGKVRLTSRQAIPHEPESHDSLWLLTQQLAWAIRDGGVKSAAEIAASPECTHASEAKELAYRLYTIADAKGWQEDALAYNALVTAWPEVQEQTRTLEMDARAGQSNLLDGLNK